VGANETSREFAARLRKDAVSLKINSSWTFAGHLVYASCQWGVLVVIARLGNPRLVGQFALALAVTTPFFMFSNMQLSGIQATDSRRVYAFGDYLALRLLLTAIAVLAIALATIPLNLTPAATSVVMIVALTKAADAVSDIFFGLLQQQERMRSVGVALIINGILTVTGMGVAMWMTQSLVWASLASLLASVFTLTAYNVRTVAPLFQSAHLLMPNWKSQSVISLARLALPLGFAAMCVSVYGNMPRYFVERSLGEQALGFFAAAAYATTAAGMVITALGQSTAPRLARYWADGNRLMFWRLLRYLTGIAALIGVAGVALTVVAGELILRIFYGVEYAKHADVFFWMMVAAAVGYMGSVLGYGINATRAFDRLVAPYAAVAVVALLSCWLLVPRHGLLGAAWAMGATNVAAGLVPPFVFASLTRRRT
jgi:O-antigen/teichoic acid export membrane protein